MRRRDLIKIPPALALLSAMRARAMVGLFGGGIAASQYNPMNANLAAGGDSTFYYEDLPLTQDAIIISRGIQTATAGSIGTTKATADSADWPTEDFGLYVHNSAQLPAWTTSAAYACGYTSRASGAETITGVGATISNIVRSGTRVTFDLTATAAAHGFTVTGGSGATDVFAYIPPYRANASNGHIDITVANVLAGKPLFTAEAIAIWKNFRQLRSMWAQNAWYRTAGYVVQWASALAIGATSGTLDALPVNMTTAVPAGTYQCIFHPTTFESTPDVRSITLATPGQTAVSWTGGLTYASDYLFFPESSATRRTAANTKSGAQWSTAGGMGIALNYEGTPQEMILAFTRACGIGAWLHLPVADDGTYFPAALTELHSDQDTSQIYNVELSNELWNGTGNANQAFNALASAAGLTVAQYLGTRLHAIANEGRTLFGSDWNTRIRLVMAWQIGAASTFEAALSYMVSQGWTPKNDIWCLSVAPYFSVKSTITVSSTVAQIESALNTATVFPVQTNSVDTNAYIEHCMAVALNYQLPGVMEAYESSWDSVGDYTSVANPNIGSTILDSGMSAIVHQGNQTLLDLGFKYITDFEVGCSSDTSSESPRYELANDYATLTTTGSPRLLGLQQSAKGAWTPSRNVVAASGTTQIDARNYLDSSPAISATYPNFTASANVSPITSYNWGLMIQVPQACTKTLKLYLTTSVSGTLNAYLDGTQVASTVAISSGLSNSAVTMVASLALAAGHHYLEFGNGAVLSGITPSSFVEFS